MMVYAPHNIQCKHLQVAIVLFQNFRNVTFILWKKYDRNVASENEDYFLFLYFFFDHFDLIRSDWKHEHAVFRIAHGPRMHRNKG